MIYLHTKTFPCLLTLLVTFYGLAATASEALSGRVHFPDDPLLYGDSLVLKVSLLDVSRADADATTVASGQPQPVTASPMAFRLNYEPQALTRKQRFTLQAVVLDTQTQRILYRTTQSYPVTASSHHQAYELRLTKIVTTKP